MAHINVKIIKVGKDFKTEQKEFMNILSRNHTKEMAVETRDVMRTKIQESIGRANSTGNLESKIEVDEIPDGHGVGNIEKLNNEAKYWRHVNFGSEAIGANWRHLVPKGAFNPGSPFPTDAESDGRFEKGAGPYSFVPKRPIAPLNYIEKTLSEVRHIISKVLRGFKS